MNKSYKKPGELTLEEKYERWKAFAAACYESQSRIASMLHKPLRRKRSIPEMDLLSMLPLRNI